MNNNRSALVTWGVIIGLLLLSALATALWPQISTQLPTLGGSSSEAAVSAPPVEEEPIHLDFSALPVPIPDNMQEITLSPFVALGILAGLVIVPVLAIGGGLAFAYAMLDRQTATIKESEEFQQEVAELEKKENERIKQMRQAHPARPMPDHNRLGWSAVSTSLIIIVFAIYVGHALARTFSPGIEADPGLVRAIVWGFMILAGLFSFFTFRPQTIRQMDASDNLSIPWGIIWTIVTGMIMVGVGSGIMLILRAG